MEIACCSNRKLIYSVNQIFSKWPIYDASCICSLIYGLSNINHFLGKYCFWLLLLFVYSLNSSYTYIHCTTWTFLIYMSLTQIHISSWISFSYMYSPSFWVFILNSINFILIFLSAPWFFLMSNHCWTHPMIFKF